MLHAFTSPLSTQLSAPLFPPSPLDVLTPGGVSVSSLLHHQPFLAALTADGGTIGNGTLQRELGWDDARYESVRHRLLNEGRIEEGRGRGGSVRRVG